jgi:methionine aminopeptidase
MGPPAVGCRLSAVRSAQQKAARRKQKGRLIRLSSVRLEENVLVTEDGYEVLTRWPIDELVECWLPYR